MSGFVDFAVPAVVAGLVAALGWHSARPLFAAYVFQRRNYRDHPLPTGVGVLIPLAVAAVVALQSVLVSLVDAFSGPRPWGIDPLRTYGPTMCALCLGFGLLGMLDDLGGVGESGGFRGHLSALAQGRLTTGAIKAFGGPLLALALLGSSLENGRFGVIREAALISLAANLVNLLDRAPGRSIKISALGAAIFVAAIGFRGAAIVGPPAGASLGLLSADLREECMIGDAGANSLGAGVGYGVVVGTSATAQWWVLGVLLLANLASEVVSFSAVIDRVPPLRWFDRLGAVHRDQS